MPRAVNPKMRPQTRREGIKQVGKLSRTGEAAAVGESVLTTQPNGPAADEIRRLYREVTK
jgi:hypothetical protein